jgi:hypothetical protein
MQSRIDLTDPLIVAVDQSEFSRLDDCYSAIGGIVEDAGDGIQLIVIENTVVARFRISRAN